MTSVFGFSREAIRVKVKKCEANQPVEFRKFSVDPQITSFEVLQSILSKAFDLRGDFAICYRAFEVTGHESYMPLLSDWDLDAAFLKAANSSVTGNSEPCLCLRVELRPPEHESSDPRPDSLPVVTHVRAAPPHAARPAPRLHGIFNQMGRTLNLVQRALNLGEDGGAAAVPPQPPRPPLSDSEFRTFLDPVGQILYARELRSVIYFGGIDPSLRKVVWKHILNVYPDGMTGRERMDYIKRKAGEYVGLRESWKMAIARGPVVGELAYTTGMVRKDVLRTDRHHPFYAGSDDNQNIASLFNILTTYALNHPRVSYCQGMSDLASPLLVTMNDEAHAYICFCALMHRLCTNFMIDGIAMTQKFTHLAEGLMYYDPEFYDYLKRHQADDLLFCYRWLLLEMKREFAFDDSLRMLEVLWSSLPALPPDRELKLFEVMFREQAACETPPVSPLLVKTPRESAYTKVCALRRQSSSVSLSNFTFSTSTSNNNKKSEVVRVKRQNHSLDETSGKNHRFDEGPKHQSLDDNILKRENSATIVTNGGATPPPQQGGGDIKSPFDSIVLHNNVNKVQTTTKPNLKLAGIAPKNSHRGHFKGLKDKIAASLERLDLSPQPPVIREDDEAPPQTTGSSSSKMIKNLNEFLNFGATKTGDKPTITLTRSSLDDDSDTISPGAYSNSSLQTTNYSTEESSPDDDYAPMTTSITRELDLELENLDRTVFGDAYVERLSQSAPEVRTRSDDVFVWENPLLKEAVATATNGGESDGNSINACEEVTELRSSAFLPPPPEFGGGNPFLMFLCITVLLQHRDHVMDKNMDYNEMAMHFDKMVRKHDVTRVLNQARQMYARYMKQHAIAQQQVRRTRHEDC